MDVLLADDDKIVSRTLQVAIESRMRGGRVIVAHDLEGAIRMGRMQGPVDVALIDLGMPGVAGRPADAVRRLQTALQDVPVVLISGAPEQGAVAAAIEAGAVECLSKAISLDELVGRLGLAADRAAPAPDLTQREADVLDLVRMGLTDAQIAERLGLAEIIVNYQVRSLLRKFQVGARHDLQPR